VTRFVATFGFIGFLPGAAGTWGSLAALPLGYLIHLIGGPLLLSVTIIVAYGLGHWATRVETFEQEDLDPSHIVIDEVVGQWIALLPLSAGLWFAGAPPALFPWPGWVAAFVFFRIFDIWKPGPVGWADRRKGPTGVMLDDVFAGALAGLVVTILAGVAHGWLM
jgi:phosphatidylglycerophosphatase A